MKPKVEVIDLLFPKARAEILRRLFSNPKEQRYVRELVMMSGLALRTVQEELAVFSAMGLVTSWSNGYQRFYRANRRHPFFAGLHSIVQESAQLPPAKLPAHRRPRNDAGQTDIGRSVTGRSRYRKGDRRAVPATKKCSFPLKLTD